MQKIQTGLEIFLKTPDKSIHNKRIGLLCNQASVDRNFQHARILINKKSPGQLTALFSPQHGFFGEKQDNMIESGDIRDPVLDIPVFSLYGKSRKPTREMFDRIDLLIIDLQDAGTRVYTFIYTMAYCLEAARKFNKKVIVLDRPNPLGGTRLEGNLLSDKSTSFVGLYPIPMRHGLTIGEIAFLFNNQFQIKCDLKIIPMDGWKRSFYFSDTGLPWVPPSPNLPTPVSAMVYPGQVLWEGTNISEGRGTAQPFELFGAPFVDTSKVLSYLDKKKLPGIILRETIFEPTSNKYNGELCKGFQIHVTDHDQYQPYATTLSLLQAVLAVHSDLFKWKIPPYEYEFTRLPIDLIIGDGRIRQKVERLDNINDIADTWEKELKAFAETSKKYYLYE